MARGGFADPTGGSDRVPHSSLPADATALTLWSCADSTDVLDGEPDFDFASLGPSLSVIPSLPAVCGVPTVARLIADKVVPRSRRATSSRARC